MSRADGHDWGLEQVRALLLEADGSAWRADREEQLRQRLGAVMAQLRRMLSESHSGENAAAEFREQGSALLAAMERALPAAPTRARWAAFVRKVHPAYDSLSMAVSGGAPAAGVIRPTNYARSALHLSTATASAISILLLPRWALVAVAGAFFVAGWGMEIGRRVSDRVNRAVMRLFGPVAHPHERHRVNSASWYVTALVVLGLFASKPAMMAAVVVLGLADPAAAFVGRRFGRHKIRAGRSLEGTAAFFCTGALSVAGVLAITSLAQPPALFWMAILSGLFGALAELLAVRLDDNLTIPLGVGAGVTLIGPYL